MTTYSVYGPAAGIARWLRYVAGEVEAGEVERITGSLRMVRGAAYSVEVSTKHPRPSMTTWAEACGIACSVSND